MFNAHKIQSGVVAAVLIGAVTFFCFSMPALAQTATGGMRGVVVDATGAALPGATVMARNTATGLEIKTTTNGEGLYSVPRIPPGKYNLSIELQAFKKAVPSVPTKSGLMVGLGETDEEILQVMRDLRAHGVDMLTIGQYLQPSPHHLAVERYVHPDVFAMFEREAAAMGFRHAAIGALVRSSYHADQQAEQAGLP